MGILSGGDFVFKLCAEALVDEMFDAVRWLVHVVERHAEVLDEVGFPQTVRTHQFASRGTALVGELQIRSAAGNPASLF